MNLAPLLLEFCTTNSGGVRGTVRNGRLIVAAREDAAFVVLVMDLAAQDCAVAMRAQFFFEADMPET